MEKALPIERGNLASRRRFLGTAGAATLALAPLRALADSMVTLPLPAGRTSGRSPPLFQRKAPLFSNAPARRSSKLPWIDLTKFRLAVRGHVNQSLALPSLIISPT